MCVKEVMLAHARPLSWCPGSWDADPEQAVFRTRRTIMKKKKKKKNELLEISFSHHPQKFHLSTRNLRQRDAILKKAGEGCVCVCVCLPYCMYDSSSLLFLLPWDLGRSFFRCCCRKKKAHRHTHTYGKRGRRLRENKCKEMQMPLRRH